ncbi:PilZ domain-containing protein [Desulfomonile tiedjei]|uniref:PilZ domain-containing protein n=1 Tax=Desulfomonile tiedjei (strain ATCC 49306 / DSM 6799 / DCB-1) TaxID=706587 RepID=I4C4J8_DESTA|nr:PilZ domain-containing protein [Desulfomonile tiedjei]AFM24489.1 PilZ domain-containing protein [Desulfomonile tiedjei DSM 6799]
MKRIRKISALELVRAISARTTRQELMDKFGFSYSSVDSIIEQLSSERHRRALKIADSLKSGIAFEDIAKENGFRVEVFAKILNTLKNMGLLSSDESMPENENTAIPLSQERRSSPRLLCPVLVTKIYEIDAPEQTGTLLDLSENGLSTQGIHGRPGEGKLLFFKISDFKEADPLPLECKCRWTSTQFSQNTPKAGFEITSMSPETLGVLKTVLANEFALAGA